jgi:glutaredoxin
MVVVRIGLLINTLIVLNALANNLTLSRGQKLSFDSLSLDDEEVRLRRHIWSGKEKRFGKWKILPRLDDESQSAPGSQLKAFKVSTEKTGAVMGGGEPQGYGASYWSGYGTDGQQPDMQMWQGGQLGAAGGQEQYPQSYGTMPGTGAIGTPNSPYAGYLEKQISSYPVMIYTLNGCEPCSRAKHLLAVHYPDVRAHFLELSGNEAWQQQLQTDLQYLTSVSTFPYIFICKSYIGGASDLFELHENGQLRRMINQCIKTAYPKT